MSETIQAGALYIVSTPIGNLDDISLRAIKVLGGVDLVAAEDTRTSRVLLDHLSITKPLVSFHSYNESRRTPELVERLAGGASIALVTDAGTPGISDPAYSLIRAAIDHGCTIIPVPGASAVLPALIASGLPMDRFVFEGFLPTKKGRKTKFEQLRTELRTIVIYESPFRIVKTVEEVKEYFGERRIAVVREITKKFEETLRGTTTEVLTQLKKKMPRGEYVLVIEGWDEAKT
jgi:16S rRNA (cytidine1402-2'-O)-methyltransferase